jgi:hypothetical protein
MLRYTCTTHRPGLRLLILQDDPDREFGYTTGAEAQSTKHTPKAGP